MSSLNQNPWVKTLLSWHGHDRAGVHVPFQRDSNPLGRTIVTNLAQRLRDLATQIAGGDTHAPQWIFLVGGPGNGKSEMVQDFLASLDQQLGLQGELTNILEQAFNSAVILPRRIDINVENIASNSENFEKCMGTLIVVQDATASEAATGDAAKELSDDILELITCPDDSPPIFIACVNRGLLTSALRVAILEWGEQNQAAQLLKAIIQASSLGLEAPDGRHSCWPLEEDHRVACWPLDLESLTVSHYNGPSPFEQILTAATREDAWEQPGLCYDCSSANWCPFRQNATWLRNQSQLNAVQRLLRHGELFTGQRWNFRDLFSLAAETLVGQWSDFAGFANPCDWVHEKTGLLSSEQYPVEPVYDLLKRLFPHALFRTLLLSNTISGLSEVSGLRNHPVSQRVLQVLSAGSQESAKPIRGKLDQEYSVLDPAKYSPVSTGHPLRVIEDEYSQSIELGNAGENAQKLSSIERLWLQILEASEREWDFLGRRSAEAFQVIQVLRREASITAKRTIGTFQGHYPYEVELSDFENMLHDRNALDSARRILQHLLWPRGAFEFNLVESFGQPQGEQFRKVILRTNQPGIIIHPAPLETPNSPGHDVPCFEVSGTNHRMPLTFEFYLALRLREKGCANSSLPASMRAAVDRVRHLHAGTICRNKGHFQGGTASIVVGEEELPPSVINMLF